MRWALVLLLAASPALADPLDTFGFGARASSMAGAMTAEASGAAAIPTNPAALVNVARPELTLGWGFGHLGLELDGAPAETLDVHGVDFGLAIPWRMGPIRAAAGVALYLPDQFVARIQLVPATEAHFVLLDNDIHRIVIQPAFAVALGDKLSIGAGASILLDAVGNGIQFDVGVVGGEPVGQGKVDVRLPVKVAPLVGLHATPLPWLRLGASWRAEVDLEMQLGILANVDVAGVVTGDALIDLQALNFFTPERLSFGVAVDPIETLTLTAELSWLRWSAFRGGAPDVNILVSLGIEPPLVQTLFPDDDFHDVWVPRAGFEWRLPTACVGWAVRGGYAFEASPVPGQTGLTSFADNDRHVVALGGGAKFLALAPTLKRPLRVDVALQWHHLRERLTVKDQDLFPGRAFSSGGDIVRLSSTATLEF
jgi:long-chain fatty acid transport protein